jgi:hypothetical protein
MGDPFNRVSMKQILAPIAGRDEPRINVRTYLLIREGTNPALQCHTLLELSEMGLSQFYLKLRLTHQDNLNQLFLIGFQIREKS